MAGDSPRRRVVTSAPAFAVLVFAVENVPLHKGDNVQLRWQCGAHEGSSPIAALNGQKSAVLNHFFKMRPESGGGSGDASYALHLCLQHLPPPPRSPSTVDKLSLTLDTIKPMCGRLGISSGQMVVFKLQFVAQASAQSEDNPYLELLAGSRWDTMRAIPESADDKEQIAELTRSLAEAEATLRLETERHRQLLAESAGSLQASASFAVEDEAPAVQGSGGYHVRSPTPAKDSKECGCVIS
jgi:hypothetical protein